MFEELRLALYWQRPSIVLAIHRSAWEQKKAVARLKEMLVKIDCTVVEIKVVQEHPSAAHQILNQPQSENSVYFVSGLDHGHEGSQAAYRALNLYRELFIENRIKTVFWLTGQEAANLALLAPDFWAFRHRVVEFGSARQKPLGIPWHNLAIWYAESEAEILQDEKILALEEALEKISTSPEGVAWRVQLLYELGYAYWNSGQVDKSFDGLAAGLDIVVRNSLADENLRFYNGCAILLLYHGHHAAAGKIFEELSQRHQGECIPRMNLGIALSAQGKNSKGISEGRKAIRLEPGDSRLQIRLGYLYISAGKLNDALTCFTKAIQLAPHKKSYRESLATCYCLLGWKEKALSEIETIYSTDEKSNILVDIYRQGILGNLDHASEMPRVELGNRETPQQRGLRDLNLRLILDLIQHP